MKLITDKIRRHPNLFAAIVGIIIFIVNYIFISKVFYPIDTSGVKPDLKDIITWELSRQLTHAVLLVTALFGIFSILQLESRILKKPVTTIIFFGLLVFLSYEYNKLMMNIPVVGKLENDWKPENNLSQNFFDQLRDPLQKFLFAGGTEISLAGCVIIALLIAGVIFFLIVLYASIVEEVTPSSER